MPLRMTKRTRETSQIVYLTEKGQIGKRTTARTRRITKIVIPLFDSVVSNLNEAYFLSALVRRTGSRVFGYLILMLYGLLKKTN